MMIIYTITTLWLPCQKDSEVTGHILFHDPVEGGLYVGGHHLAQVVLGHIRQQGGDGGGQVVQARRQPVNIHLQKVEKEPFVHTFGIYLKGHSPETLIHKSYCVV